MLNLNSLAASPCVISFFLVFFNATSRSLSTWVISSCPSCIPKAWGCQDDISTLLKDDILILLPHSQVPQCQYVAVRTTRIYTSRELDRDGLYWVASRSASPSPKSERLERSKIPKNQKSKRTPIWICRVPVLRPREAVKSLACRPGAAFA